MPSPSPEATAVLRALDQILSSQPFRTSKQCQDLLRYIVDHSLRGDDGALRERVVGVAVFGRATDYDTSEDPVVRMRAADVRKRLAQYYQSAEQESPDVHIELRPGSYRAGFRLEVLSPGGAKPTSDPTLLTGDLSSSESLSSTESVPPTEISLLPGIPEASMPPRRRPRLMAWLLGALVLLLASVGIAWRAHETRPEDAQHRFWAPMTQSGRPVLLYLGSNVAYILRPELLESYQHEHGKEYTGPEFFPTLPKGGSVRAEDLLPQKNTFVTVGDLAASAQLVALMSRWSMPFLLRSAEDVSMGDLRSTPTVLIGGFNNRWTLETMNDLPFAFRDGRRIQSRSDPSHGWSIPAGTHGENTEDFALISRVLHADTGGPVVAIGGIGSFGTQAAAEFAASAEEMNKLLNNAPPGWEKKNMQVVLRIKVVGYSPVAVDVVETAYW